MIGAMLGVPLPIETHLLQAMVTEPIKPLLHTVLISMFPGHGETYILQSDRGGIVMGGHLDGFPSYTREGRWERIEDVVAGDGRPAAAGRPACACCGNGPAPTTRRWTAARSSIACATTTCS